MGDQWYNETDYHTSNDKVKHNNTHVQCKIELEKKKKKIELVIGIVKYLAIKDHD